MNSLMLLLMTAIFGIEALAVLAVLITVIVVLFRIRVPVKADDGRQTVHTETKPDAKPAETEEERLARERGENENKAFSQLMGYSAEQAYGMVDKTGMGSTSGQQTR